MQLASPAAAGWARQRARALVVAHRGAWEDAPQNSLEAFEEAIELGCDAVELDVRRTADGQLVVVHDARVRGRAVAKLTRDELQIRAKEGQAPPTLESVLALVAGAIAVDLELKEDGYVEQVMEVVAARLTPEQYVVSSFRDAVLPAVRHWVPDARTGLLISPQRRVGDLERRVGKAQVDFLAPHASLTRTGLLAWAAARGLPSWVWTVNDPRALASLLADARVEAVVTDRPRRALDISRSRAL